MKGTMPVLYRMHLDFTPIQGKLMINQKGSSTPSERMFSSAKKVIKSDRCSLGADTIEMLMMEKHYLKPVTEQLRKEMNMILGRKQVFLIN